MDDEAIDAAARAIRFLGEAAVRASAADLVTRARSVELAAAAAAAGANADHIAAAATMLENVELEGRVEAVSGLLGAATALEAALGVDLKNLRDAAADLARQCAEHREAVEAIEKVRCAAEPREDWSARAPPPWWRLLLPPWRRWGGRVSDLEAGLLAAGLTPTLQEPEIMDAAKTAVHFLRNEAIRSDHLVQLTDKIVLSAHGLAAPYQSLAAARDALQQADSSSSMNAALNGLEAAATTKGEASTLLTTLRSPAVQLAAACQEYLEGCTAMAAVQRVTIEWARQRESVGVSVQNTPPSAPGLGQGDDRRSGWLGHALCGSLTLVPYLAATIPIDDKPPSHLVSHDRLKISLALSIWWSIVATGTVCSCYARSWIEMCYAQLAARVGIWGINIFAIYFFYWILAIEDIRTRCYCLWIASGVHFLFFLLACWRRDPYTTPQPLNSDGLKVAERVV